MTVEYKSYADEVKKRMDKSIDMILEGTGLIVEKASKDLTPVDTGHLRRSINYETINSQNAVAIGTNVEYAITVELGIAPQGGEKNTEKSQKSEGQRGHNPQPFLQPGAMNSVNRIKQLAGKILSGQMGGSK